MNNKYEVKDILEAIDTLLKEEKKLKLVNEVENKKIKLDDIPESTEKIISQAEKYLKK